MALIALAPLRLPSDIANIRVNAAAELQRLINEQDTDHDKKITVLDCAPPTFWLNGTDKSKFEVSGRYQLSNLLQELKLLADRGETGVLRGDRIFENPVNRLSRQIRERYWDHLTRRVDIDHLAKILEDSKASGKGPRYVYVPPKDDVGFNYFTRESKAHPELRFEVLHLPRKKDHDGVLSLAFEKAPGGGLRGVPFVVPGGRFNEMYGWDSYFETLGLVVDGRMDLARAMVDNFVYQIENYGKILNANRSYYLNRSQPPFMTSMLSAVYERTKMDKGDRAWLARGLRAAIAEYKNVWTDADHMTPTGLSRYFGRADRIPPEVEPGHFDPILKPAAKRLHMSMKELTRQFNSGQLKDPELEAFFGQDLAVRESGHDTTYRWRVDGVDRAADFATVDLNSLLYKFESDVARLIRTEFDGLLPGTDERPNAWVERAKKRQTTMLELMWDPDRKAFFDYDFRRKQRGDYLAATTLYPLWAKLVTPEMARELTRTALARLEVAGGLVATDSASLAKYGDNAHARQWEFPNGWAPHQMLSWQGLRNYGLDADAERLTYRWLYMISRAAADYNGTVPEKFDVVRRSHAVFAEYGNVGTQFAYITEEGFGWMNASFEVGLNTLTEGHRIALERLTPPEWLF